MDAESKRIVKSLQDRLAVLNIRLGYAKNRREIEKEQITQEIEEIKDALDWFCGTDKKQPDEIKIVVLKNAVRALWGLLHHTNSQFADQAEEIYDFIKDW